MDCEFLKLQTDAFLALRGSRKDACIILSWNQKETPYGRNTLQLVITAVDRYWMMMSS